MVEQITLAPQSVATELVTRVKSVAAASAGRRLAIGLIGGPGTGKSTISASLVQTLNAQGIPTALVPMDGFHMRHAKLEALGLVAQKGAPHTFEAQAFVDFLSTLKAAEHPVSGPIYTRDIEDVTDNGYIVAPDVQVLIVEGNYLLLDVAPWDRLRPLLDLAIHLDLPREIIRERLLRRHAEHGLFSSEHIARHVETVDMPNYDLVAATADRADVAITVDTAL